MYVFYEEGNIVFHQQYFHVFIIIQMYNATTGARGTDLPPTFFLTFCLQIYFQ